MKIHIIPSLLCTALLSTMAWAQDSSQTPKKETLAQAIEFEKHKIAAADAQARKDAAEASGSARKSSASRKTRKQGQADNADKAKQ